MGKNKYVGHRYVPKIEGEWDKTKSYESLTVVLYQGASYTSRQNVPVGVEITNEEFWVLTGNYNAQIEQYRQDVRNLENDVTAQLGHIGYNVITYGAVGDNITDDTHIIQQLIDSVEDNSVILFPQGYTFKIETLNVDGKRITFQGYGATINSQSSQGAFYKTDHNNRLVIEGLTFIGTGKAINWVTTSSGTQYDEFSFESCNFYNEDYGIYLDGVREGRIAFCSFEGVNNKGVYRVRSVNHEVVSCYWKNTKYGVNDDGDGTAYSAGVKVIGGTMLGCEYGIRTSMVDYAVISDVMIDYCDNPLVILGVDIASVKGCYITTRTTAPAILVDKGSDDRYSREIRIVENAIASNVDNAVSDTVHINGVATGLIASNSITFWWRYGIKFSNCQYLKIEGNKINPDGTSAVAGACAVIETEAGNSTNQIYRNEVNKPIETIYALVANNTGFATERRGEVFVPSGSTTFTIEHGLKYTPSKSHIKLTPTNREAGKSMPFVASVSETEVIIGFSTETTATAGVAWEVKRTLL